MWSFEVGTRRAQRVTFATGSGRIGIEAWRSFRYTIYQGGEWQRAPLARALLMKPDLLVLDEPVQGVDVQGQIELY